MSDLWSTLVRPDVMKDGVYHIRSGVVPSTVRKAISRLELALAPPSSLSGHRSQIYGWLEKSVSGNEERDFDAQHEMLMQVAQQFPLDAVLGFYEKHIRSSHAVFWPVPADLERHCLLWADDIRSKISFLEGKLDRRCNGGFLPKTDTSDDGKSFQMASGRTVTVSSAIQDKVNSLRTQREKRPAA